jgi:hypothetical protein
VLILPLPTACPKLCNKPPFSAFTMPLYMAFRGRWPDLAYGISGVWVLGPKLHFHFEGPDFGLANSPMAGACLWSSSLCPNQPRSGSFSLQVSKALTTQIFSQVTSPPPHSTGQDNRDFYQLSGSQSSPETDQEERVLVISPCPGPPCCTTNLPCCTTNLPCCQVLFTCLHQSLTKSH